MESLGERDQCYRWSAPRRFRWFPVTPTLTPQRVTQSRQIASIALGVTIIMEEVVANMWCRDQLFNAADKRLARALILLAHCGTPGTTRRVPPGISQQTVADIVGTTRSRVNIFLKKFTKLGYIEYNDGLKVNDSLVRVILRDERVRTKKFKTG